MPLKSCFAQFQTGNDNNCLPTLVKTGIEGGYEATIIGYHWPLHEEVTIN